MKLGFDLGKLTKMKKMRKIFTPVLVIALVLCGLWLPDVKVKAWEAGIDSPATLKIVFDLDGGTDDGHYSNGNFTFTSTGYSAAGNIGNGQYYNFGNANETVNFFEIPYCIPAKNGKLATRFILADRNIEGYIENSPTIGDIVLGQSYDINVFSGVNVSRFNGDGVCEVVFKAVYEGDPIELNYHFGDNDTDANGIRVRTTNAIYAIRFGANNDYYFKIENVPTDLGYLNNENLTYTHSFIGDVNAGDIYDLNGDWIRTMGEGGTYLYSTYESDTSAISFSRTFYPYYAFYFPVTFDPGEHGQISGTSEISANETFETDHGDDDGYGYNFRLASFPAITAEPGYTFTGKWEMVNPSEHMWLSDINNINNRITPTTTPIDASTGARVHVEDATVENVNNTGNIRAVFKAVYKPDLTLTVNFDIADPEYSNDPVGPFPAGSKYLTPLTLSIPAPDQTPEYYEFTIPGSSIDEVPIVYDTSYLSPHPHYLRSFTPDSNVIYGSAQPITLGEDTVVRVKSSAFQNNAATLTLTAGFSGRAYVTLFYSPNSGGSSGDLTGFTTIGGTEYGIFVAHVDPSVNLLGDGIPDGLINYAGYWNYVGADPILIRDSKNNDVSRLINSTDYTFYVPKTLLDTENGSRTINIEPATGLAMDVIFDAGENGTITGEGTASTKTVSVSSKTINNENNWEASVDVPAVTGKNGYAFKQWVQQQLPTETIPAGETDIEPATITSSGTTTFTVGDTYARSNAGDTLRSSGITYTAEYYTCDVSVSYQLGDHAAVNVTVQPYDATVYSYNASTGKFSVSIAFPTFETESGWALTGFVATNDTYVSTNTIFTPGTTRTIEVTPPSGGGAVRITFAAQYSEMPVLTVNFFVGGMQSGTTGVINPVSNTPDSDGYYSYSVTIPNITSYTDGFGAAFPVDSISSSLQGQNDIIVYRGGSNLESDDIADNETVTVAVKQNMTLTWDATYAIKQTGAYELYDGNFCLTRGNWSVAITGGESDGYTYNVTDPVYIYPGSNRELTFTK